MDVLTRTTIIILFGLLCNSNADNSFRKVTQFISNLVESSFLNCSLIILHEKFNSELFADEVAVLATNFQSNQFKEMYIINSNISGTFKRIGMVSKLRKGLKSQCALTLTFNENTDMKFLSGIFNRHLTPHRGALTKFDDDYYIFVSQYAFSKAILFSSFATKLKYRILFPVSPQRTEILPSNSTFLHFQNVCFYCSMGNSNLENKNVDPNSVINLNVLFPDSPKDFNGHILRLATPTKVHGFLEISKSKSGLWSPLRGPEKYLLHTVRTKFNFSLIVFQSTGVDDQSAGGTGLQLPNGTWIGCVGDILYDRAEFCTTSSPISSRYQIVDFTTQYGYGWLTFITGKASPAPISWKPIMGAFSLMIWILIAGTFLISTAVYIIFEKMGKSSTHQVLYNLFATVLSQGAPNPTRNPTRVFFVFWLFFSMIMTTAYVSKLVTSLAFPAMNEPPKTFKELVNSKYKWGLHGASRGGAGELYLKYSTISTFKKLYQQIDLDPGNENCFSSTIQSKYACVAYKQIIDYMLNKNYIDSSGYHDFYISLDSTLFLTTTWMIPPGAIYRQNFDSIFMWTRDVGLFEKWASMDFSHLRKKRLLPVKKISINLSKGDQERKNSVGWKERDKRTLVLNLQNLKGSFSILFAGYSIAFAYFLVEVCRKAQFTYKTTVKTRRLVSIRPQYKSKLLNILPLQFQS